MSIVLGLYLACSVAAASPTLSGEQKLVVDSFVAATRGSADSRVQWVTEHMDLRDHEARKRWLTVWSQMAETTGGLSLDTVEQQGRKLVLRVKTSKQGLVRQVELVLAQDGSSKVVDVIARPLPTPYPEPLIDKPVSRSVLVGAIDRRVRYSLERDEFSGVVLVTNPEELYFRAGGFADRDFSVPNQRGTRFHIASMGKMFTAVAIAQLIEQGKLSLETKIGAVLPDYPNRMAAEKVTVRHLLAHTSGLGSLIDRPAFQPHRVFTNVSDELSVFAAEPLLFEPGTKGQYSNEGFIVLGAMIEKIAGSSFYDYVHKNVFEPAGMRDTVFYSLDQIAPHRAVGYRYLESDPLGVGTRGPNWTSRFLKHRGNSMGGAFSTVDDMTRFLRAFRDGKLVSRSTAEALLVVPDVGLPTYAHGFDVRKEGGRTLVGHTGGGPHSGINGAAFIVWETGYACAVLGNYDSPFAQTLAADIARMLATQLR